MRKENICSFLIGVSVGAATGLLLAPLNGKKARRRVTATANNVSDKMMDFIELGKDELARQREMIDEIIKRGAHVYKRAVS